MNRYRIERAGVLVLGFLVGAGLAMCVAPGDILLAVAAGAALTIFSHAFFIRQLGGELFWPSVAPRHDLHCSPFRHLISRLGGSSRRMGPTDASDAESPAKQLTFRKAHRHGN